jgi:hypothetical protein
MNPIIVYLSVTLLRSAINPRAPWLEYLCLYVLDRRPLETADENLEALRLYLAYVITVEQYPLVID